MTAFVAGATGYVGGAVVRRLRELDRPVVAHVRPGSSRLAEHRERFAELGAEVDDTAWALESMQLTLQTRKPDQVYCLIGTTRKQARGEGIDDPYEEVDFGLTRLLAEATVAAGITPRFVYLSSIGASPTARSRYLAARGRAEEAVRKSGLPFTIARPSFITGPDRPERRVGERTAAALTDAFTWTAGVVGLRYLRKYRSTNAARLAVALVRLADDRDAAGCTVEPDELHALSRPA